MASAPDPEDGLIDYERLRQENIRRNEAMLASVRRKADELSAAVRSAKPKRGRPKGSMNQPGKKLDTPSGPSRCSLRSAGLPPPYLLPDPQSTHLSSSLASSILGAASPPPAEAETRADDFHAGKELVLKPAHVRRVIKSTLKSMQVLPLVDRTVVAAGNKLGNIGFWDVDAVSEDQDGGGTGNVFLYRPHRSPVAAIVAHQAAPQKIYSCSYKGEICLMDFEKENFNMVHLWDSPVYSLCQAQNCVRCLYFGDENGGLTLFDERVGKVSTTWDVHDERINSIEFHPENTHMLATSSTDQTACIWDVRSMKTKEPDSLKVFELHGHAQSAYFSPSGRMLAITSSCLGGTVRVFSMDDFEMSHEHNNQTGSWLDTFKVIWGWNDTDLYVGDMRGAIDIISVDVNDSGISALNNTCLQSEYMTSVPCQLSAHPYKVGHLACANSYGKVFLWTTA
uniref:Uncharacterized protein n=1 Tax=Avena sativa TaxID=4498 RepID=A0ACD5YUG2_AVESA